MNSTFKLDYIGIGSGKCGSTWLYENLVQHPDFCDTNLKELNYFSDLYDEHPFSWYTSQFSGCHSGMIKGEFSVTYLSHPLAARRIKQHFPDIKVIAIIRNPTDRTYSNYLHSLRKGDITESTSFADYITNPENLAPAQYYDHFRSWYSTFDRNNILVLVMEEFTKDPDSGYKSIYDFIGCNNRDFLPKNSLKRRNEARFYKHLWIENILVRTYRWLSRRGHTKLVRLITDTKIANIIRNLNKDDKEPPTIDSRSREVLAQHFKPYNDRLSELLQRDLSLWDAK